MFHFMKCRLHGAMIAVFLAHYRGKSTMHGCKLQWSLQYMWLTHGWWHSLFVRFVTSYHKPLEYRIFVFKIVCWTSPRRSWAAQYLVVFSEGCPGRCRTFLPGPASVFCIDIVPFLTRFALISSVLVQFLSLEDTPWFVISLSSARDCNYSIRLLVTWRSKCVMIVRSYQVNVLSRHQR